MRAILILVSSWTGDARAEPMPHLVSDARKHYSIARFYRFCGERTPTGLALEQDRRVLEELLLAHRLSAVDCVVATAPWWKNACAAASVTR
jgi:hypothetical protein